MIVKCYFRQTGKYKPQSSPTKYILCHRGFGTQLSDRRMKKRYVFFLFTHEQNDEMFI